MITLQEIFDDLASGEFTSMSLGNSALGSIVEAQYPKVVSSLNLGLLELYKRFKLKQKECTVHQHADVTTYYLRTDYLGPVADLDDEAYIVEVEDDPFEDDIIRILEIYDADNEVIPLNDYRYPDTGVFLLAFDTLSMVPADPVEVRTIVYQARYPKIILTDPFDPKDIELYFPDFIKEALLLYMASRIYKGKTSKAAEGTQNLGITFLAQFEAACKRLEQLGLAETRDLAHERFAAKGWV